MEKIIQISAIPETEDGSEKLFALTNRGNIWVCYPWELECVDKWEILTLPDLLSVKINEEE